MHGVLKSPTIRGFELDGRMLHVEIVGEAGDSRRIGTRTHDHVGRDDVCPMLQASPQRPARHYG